MVVAYEGPAVLRWRVNGSTVIDCNVAAVVDATRTGWQVSAVASTDDDQWGLEMFPRPLQLIFPDGSSFEVDAESTGARAWRVTESVR